MIRVVVLLSLLFYPNIFALGQVSETIQAKIVDSKTNEPIPFATVKIVNGKLLIGGVISNGSGDFQIPLSYSSGMDSAIISCIGYSNLVLKTGELSKDKINVIK